MRRILSKEDAEPSSQPTEDYGRKCRPLLSFTPGGIIYNIPGFEEEEFILRHDHKFIPVEEIPDPMDLFEEISEHLEKNPKISLPLVAEELDEKLGNFPKVASFGKFPRGRF